MKKWLRNNDGIWKGVFALILGLVMVVWPGLTTHAIVIFIGVALLVLGIVLLISWFRRKKAGMPVRIPLGATICLLIGLAMVLMPQLFINILMVVFGILLILAGLDQLLTLFFGKRAGAPVSAWFYIAPVVILLVGFYIMFSPALTAKAFILVFGITSIVYGIITLYDTYILNQRVKMLEE